MTHTLPPPVVFTHNEILHAISLPPLAAFLISLTAPEHLLKLNDILDRYRTPKSYHRVDVREVSSSELPPSSPTWEGEQGDPNHHHQDGEVAPLTLNDVSNGNALEHEHTRTQHQEGQGKDAQRLAEEEREKGEPIELQEGMTVEEYRALQSALEADDGVAASGEAIMDREAIAKPAEMIANPGAPFVNGDNHPLNGDGGHRGSALPATASTPEHAPSSQFVEEDIHEMIDVIPRQIVHNSSSSSIHIDGLPRTLNRQPPKVASPIRSTSPSYRSPPAAQHHLPPSGPKRRIRELRLDLRTLDAAALFALENWRRAVLGLEKLDLEHPDSIWYKAPSPEPEPEIAPARNKSLSQSAEPGTGTERKKRGRPRKSRTPEEVDIQVVGEEGTEVQIADGETPRVEEDTVMGIDAEGPKGGQRDEQPPQSSVLPEALGDFPITDEDVTMADQVVPNGDVHATVATTDVIPCQEAPPTHNVLPSPPPSPDVIIHDVYDERPDQDPDFVPIDTERAAQPKRKQGRPRRSELVVEIQTTRTRPVSADTRQRSSTLDRDSPGSFSRTIPTKRKTRSSASASVEPILISSNSPEKLELSPPARSRAGPSWTRIRAPAPAFLPFVRAPMVAKPKSIRNPSPLKASAFPRVGQSVNHRDSMVLDDVDVEDDIPLTLPNLKHIVKKRRTTFDGVELELGRGRGRSQTSQSGRSGTSSVTKSTIQPRKSEPVVRFQVDQDNSVDVGIQSEGEEEIDELDELVDESDDEQDEDEVQLVLPVAKNNSKMKTVGGKGKARGNGMSSVLAILRGTAGSTRVVKDDDEQEEWDCFKGF